MGVKSYLAASASLFPSFSHKRRQRFTFLASRSLRHSCQGAGREGKGFIDRQARCAPHTRHGTSPAATWGQPAHLPAIAIVVHALPRVQVHRVERLVHPIPLGPLEVPLRLALRLHPPRPCAQHIVHLHTTGGASARCIPHTSSPSAVHVGTRTVLRKFVRNLMGPSPRFRLKRLSPAAGALPAMQVHA